MDILCAKCGEPWDSYGVNNGDMTPAEARKFKSGQGCPCCGFGTICPQCNGSGVEAVHNCPHQCRNGLVLAWMPMIPNQYKRYCDGRWYTGYNPNVKALPEEAVRLREIGIKQTGDGPVREAWFRCPFHKKEDELVCHICNGDGKLHCDDPDMDLKAAESACEASDEDPISILMERKIL